MKKIGQGIVKAYKILESLSNGWCEQCGLYFIASEEEILAYLVDNSVEKNMGACMKALKANFGTNMDGKVASAVAKKYSSC